MNLLSIIVVKLLEVLKKSKRLPLVNREQSAVRRRLVVVARRRWMYILYLLTNSGLLNEGRHYQRVKGYLAWVLMYVWLIVRY